VGPAMHSEQRHRQRVCLTLQLEDMIVIVPIFQRHSLRFVCRICMVLTLTVAAVPIMIITSFKP